MLFSIKEIINYNTISPFSLNKILSVVEFVYIQFPFKEINMNSPETDHFAKSDFEVSLGESPAIRARQQLHRKMESSYFLESLKWKQNMRDTAHQNSLFHYISMNTRY